MNSRDIRNTVNDGKTGGTECHGGVAHLERKSDTCFWNSKHIVWKLKLVVVLELKMKALRRIFGRKREQVPWDVIM
jgi:hypothetical protein